MSRPLTLLLFASIVGLASACGSGRVWMPTVDEIDAYVPLSSDDRLVTSEGRILAVTECSECHRLAWPQDHDRGEWPGILREMGQRGGFGEDEVEALTRYFILACDATELAEERARAFTDPGPPSP